MISKVIFVAVNILSSGILFFRSFLFLKYLPDKDLGLIMLFQAIIAMLGLLQLGLYSGGLRVFSIDSNSNQYQTFNNTNVSFTILITGIIIMFSVFLKSILKFDLIFFTLAALIGGFALLKNWFSNLLIARKKLKEINILNFVSSVVSALSALLIFKFGTIGALISISSLYIVFIIMFLFWQKEYIPNKFRIDINAIKTMLYFGFIPYLSGIAILLNNQLDRFIIVEAISMEALGQFYLAVTFVTVFDMLPGNLNSLFAPVAINNYACKKLEETIKTTKTFFLILLLYSFLAAIVLFFLGEKVVLYLFPDKINQLKYLFIMLPGIVAITLSKPFSFILYIALNLKAILWSNILSFLIYITILIYLLLFHRLTIENIAIGKSVQGVFILLILISSTLISWKKIVSFYFINKKSI
jgi:O-antigen/teichoic acid export membrane protein